MMVMMMVMVMMLMVVVVVTIAMMMLVMMMVVMVMVMMMMMMMVMIQGGMLLVTSLGEATIPADANTGQACRRVVAVGSSPAYHRLSHANT